MHATKETCVLSFAAMVAGGSDLIRAMAKSRSTGFTSTWTTFTAAWALQGWIIVTGFLQFLLYPLRRSCKALGAYFHTVDRAGGQGHEKFSAIAEASYLIMKATLAVNSPFC